MSHAFVATPCYGDACVGYVSSVLRLQSACREIGTPVEFYFHIGESLVTRARNECVARFLGSQATHLLFIDADIGFKPESALRLLESGFSVVAGAYPLKCDELRFPVDYEALGPVHNGFCKAPAVTTGFMCVARAVFETIRVDRPDLRYVTDDGQERFAFFDSAIVDGRYLSEDYAFCRLWESVGGEVYLDTTPHLVHHGRKAYSGSLQDGLTRN